MKVSIWQQFSSNHSAAFTIIGRFETTEQAQQAEATLRDMFQQIQDWIGKHPTDAAHHQTHWDTPSPVENKLNAPYQIDWIPSLMEWFVNRYEDGRIHDALGRYDNFIFLGESNTWSGGSPLHELLPKLGADILMSSEAFEKSIESTVVITAPDTATADALHNVLRTDYHKYGTFESCPWLPYVRTHDNLKLANLQRALNKGFDYNRIRHTYQTKEDLTKLQIELLPRMSKKEFDDTLALIKADQPPADKEVRRALELNWEMSLDYENIVRVENTITLQNCFLGEMATGFPAFVEWLKSQNCQVTYTFEGGSYNESE